MRRKKFVLLATYFFVALEVAVRQIKRTKKQEKREKQINMLLDKLLRMIKLRMMRRWRLNADDNENSGELRTRKGKAKMTC